MSRTDTSKRNLSSSSSASKQDVLKSKVFITPNRYALLSEDPLPDVFSPPSVSEPSSAQGVDTITPVIVNENTNRAPPIFIKNLTNLPKLNDALTSILGPDGFTFKSSKEYVKIHTINTTQHKNAVTC